MHQTTLVAVSLSDDVSSGKFLAGDVEEDVVCYKDCQRQRTPSVAAK